MSQGFDGEGRPVQESFERFDHRVGQDHLGEGVGERVTGWVGGLEGERVGERTVW